MRTQLLSLCIAILIFICSSTEVYSQKSKDDPNPKYVEVNLPMEDGVLLATDIYFPKKHGKFPVVLVRTPYNKSVEQWMGKMFGFFGIAVVVQDCRGKFKSEGVFYPFINERADGLSTLKWIREQPWSDGTIAGWGSSYVGYTQWAISDSLDFMTLFLTGANLYDFTYPDGSFSLQSAFVWGFQNASQDLNSIQADSLMESLKILPLSAADDSTIREIPFITDWMKHEKYDSYWENLNFRGKSSTPMISMTGWYDIFLKAGINDFQAAIENGDTESRLIIGPWCHGSQGEVNLYGGIKKTGKPQKVFIYVKNVLKGKKNKLTKPLKNSRSNLFIMERNEYTGSDVWPPEETTITP
jgi:putative CocE/NonD family hydrolase